MEKHVQMASNRGAKGGHMKSRPEEGRSEDDDDHFLEDLVVRYQSGKAKEKDNVGSNLKLGGFHHEGRRSQRQIG